MAERAARRNTRAVSAALVIVSPEYARGFTGRTVASAPVV